MVSMKAKVSLTLRIPEKLHEAYRERAHRERKSLNQVLTEVLEERVTTRPTPAPKRKQGAARQASTPPPDALSSDDLNALLEWTCDAEPTQAHRVEALVQECLDHFRGEGKKKQDWIATCRNWIRRDRQYREQRGGARGNGLRPGPITQAIRNIAARDAARAGREDAHAEQAVRDVYPGGQRGR